MGPAGLHENRTHLNCEGGATGYVDKVILGDHMYKYPTSMEAYHSGAFDPEGILGLLKNTIKHKSHCSTPNPDLTFDSSLTLVVF